MINWRNKVTGVRALWRFDNRWQLISERLFSKNHGVSVYRLGETEFLIDHEAGDHNGTRLCIISDLYTRFLPVMNLGDTISVFDLGANGGGFPLMLHLHGKRFSRLVCVEMNPNTFCRLQYNVTRNVPCEPTLINGAVCGEHRQFELFLGRGDISDSIYTCESTGTLDGRQRYVVQGYTFDELFRAQFGTATVDICKMDIEGAEYEAMATPEHQCLRACRYLLVELHTARPERLALFASELDAAGFALLDPGNDKIPGERLYVNDRLR